MYTLFSDSVSALGHEKALGQRMPLGRCWDRGRPWEAAGGHAALLMNGAVSRAPECLEQVTRELAPADE